MGKLFGTDGVRGIANKDLTPEMAFRLGEAAGHFLANKGHGKIVIGRDTRRSGEMLESALVSGLLSTGADAIICGIVPTPAVAFLIRELGADGGVVISASHNPPDHNGIKLFNKEGSKLSDDLEHEIEEFVLNLELQYERPTGKAVGVVTNLPEATDKYVKHCVSTLNNNLGGLKVAIDCGHGASYKTTVSAFSELGAEVVAINTDFTGSDINVDCGSTNLSAVSELVKSSGAHIGVAHDGDADRVLAVDENGDVIDGDVIMAICADSLKKSGKLTANTVVSTVMANLGFDKAMERLDIKLVKASVGDRYVLEQMKANDAVFGGEQSGHIIFFEHNSTGDGLVTALQLAAALKESGKKLSDLAKIMQKYPQVMVNVPVKDKVGLETNEKVQDAIKNAEDSLGDTGRVLVRPSGTESLIRVMVEAAKVEQAEKLVSDIVKVVEKELN